MKIRGRWFAHFVFFWCLALTPSAIIFAADDSLIVFGAVTSNYAPSYYEVYERTFSSPSLQRINTVSLSSMLTAAVVSDFQNKGFDLFLHTFVGDVFRQSSQGSVEYLPHNLPFLRIATRGKDRLTTIDSTGEVLEWDHKLNSKPIIPRGAFKLGHEAVQAMVWLDEFALAVLTSSRLLVYHMTTQHLMVAEQITHQILQPGQGTLSTLYPYMVGNRQGIWMIGSASTGQSYQIFYYDIATRRILDGVHSTGMYESHHPYNRKTVQFIGIDPVTQNLVWIKDRELRETQMKDYTTSVLDPDFNIGSKLRSLNPAYPATDREFILATPDTNIHLIRDHHVGQTSPQMTFANLPTTTDAAEATRSKADTAVEDDTKTEDALRFLKKHLRVDGFTLLDREKNLMRTPDFAAFVNRNLSVADRIVAVKDEAKLAEVGLVILERGKTPRVRADNDDTICLRSLAKLL